MVITQAMPDERCLGTLPWRCLAAERVTVAVELTPANHTAEMVAACVTAGRCMHPLMTAFWMFVICRLRYPRLDPLVTHPEVPASYLYPGMWTSGFVLSFLLLNIMAGVSPGLGGSSELKWKYREVDSGQRLVVKRHCMVLV